MTATHAISAALADVALDHQRAAAHAVHAAGQAAGSEVAGVAFDRQRAPCHLAGDEIARVAAHDHLAAAQAGADVVADGSIDDQRAAVHLPADAVAARAVAFEDELAVVARREAEQLGQRHECVAVADVQARHVR
jgi:hypothetical protein